MTERGLPIVDGAPACPFVALEDDRDARATAPDHRHRCYAETRPAPRALAHQEAYCLSSAFPVCPTFQDWARREAAAARPAAPPPSPTQDDAPRSRPMPPLSRDPRHAADITPPPLAPGRNPPRGWADPPPWAGDDVPSGDPASPASPAGREPLGDWGSAARGLAGSRADRLAGGGDDIRDARPMPDASDLEAAGPPARLARPVERGPGADDPPPAADDWRGRPPPSGSRQVARSEGQRRTPPSRGREPAVRPPEPDELFGPAWERPQRYEAYPTLRTRMGLPGLPGVPSVALAFVALVLAALALFFLGPVLLGIGGDDPLTPGAGRSSAPSASAGPSQSVAPTPTPAPTPQVYVVASGDTLSKIATRFGVTLEQLLAANPQITDADKIRIGDQISIPDRSPDEVPGEVSASEAP